METAAETKENNVMKELVIHHIPSAIFHSFFSLQHIIIAGEWENQITKPFLYLTCIVRGKCLADDGKHEPSMCKVFSVLIGVCANFLFCSGEHFSTFPYIIFTSTSTS